MTSKQRDTQEIDNKVEGEDVPTPEGPLPVVSAPVNVYLELGVGQTEFVSRWSLRTLMRSWLGVMMTITRLA